MPKTPRLVARGVWRWVRSPCELRCACYCHCHYYYYYYYYHYYYYYYCYYYYYYYYYYCYYYYYYYYCYYYYNTTRVPGAAGDDGARDRVLRVDRSHAGRLEPRERVAGPVARQPLAELCGEEELALRAGEEVADAAREGEELVQVWVHEERLVGQRAQVPVGEQRLDLARVPRRAAERDGLAAQVRHRRLLARGYLGRAREVEDEARVGGKVDAQRRVVGDKVLEQHVLGAGGERKEVGACGCAARQPATADPPFVRFRPGQGAVLTIRAAAGAGRAESRAGATGRACVEPRSARSRSERTPDLGHRGLQPRARRAGGRDPAEQQQRQRVHVPGTPTA